MALHLTVFTLRSRAAGELGVRRYFLIAVTPVARTRRHNLSLCVMPNQGK